MKGELGVKKLYKLCIAVIICCLMLAGAGHIYAAGSISDAEAAKKELEKKKRETKEKIAALEKEKGNILVYVEKLDKQLAQLEDEIDETNQKIGKTEKTLERTKQELQEAKEQEEKQYEAMKLRIKYMYENGSTDYLELLVESDSFADFLNRTEYIAKISEYDKEMYERHKEMKKQVEEKEASLEDKLDELENLKAELKLEEDTVNELREDKQAEIAKYEANIDQASEAVKKYNQQIEEQEQLIEKLLEEERKRIEEEERKKREEEERRKREEEERRKREAAQRNNAGSSAGSTGNSTGSSAGSSGGDSDSDISVDNTADGFRWPLNVSGKITSSFGGRKSPTAGASSNHKGIDISAPTGTNIVAAAAGTVVTATYSSSAGNYIMIYHGKSTYTVYMHCSRLSVSVNDKVSKGQKIGEVGSTGISTGSHLHFGVSVNGSYVNPLNYVSQ